MLPVVLTPVSSGIKYATPICKVEIAATPLTVPSLGLDSVYYVFTGNTPAWSEAERAYPVSGYNAIRPLVSEYYFEGQPPTVPPLNFMQNERWAEQCSGYFVDTIGSGAAQSYNFYAAGEGKIQLTISGVNVINQLVWESNETFATGTISLTPGQWLPINIKYYQTSHLHNGFTILWQNADMDEPIPISAGVTARTVSGFVEYSELRSVGDLQIHKAQKESHTCSFQVPLASTLDYVGYQHNQATKQLRCVESGYTDIAIKKGYLTKVSLGFNYGSADHWVSSFTGNVLSVGSPRRANTGDVLDITLCDFKFLCQEISENYPQVDDYWNTYQIGDQTGAGGTHWHTPAFDNWRLDNVYKAMLIKAGVDPTLLVKHRTFLNHDNAEVSGGYMIEPSNIPASGFNRLYLEKQSKYGHPNSQDTASQDADYLYKFNFGDKIIDIIDNVANNFGYAWGFNAYYDGAPYLTAANNPITFIDQEDFTFRDHWTAERTEPYAIGASVRRSNWQSTEPGDQAAVDITCTGTAFDLIVIAGRLYGYSYSKASAGWEIKRTKDSHIVATGTLNPYHTSSSWAYYQGIDPNLGYNPSVINLVSGLPYEGYQITVSSYCNRHLVVDGLFAYERDYRTPVLTLRTMDTATHEGNISELSAEDTIENMCNDLIVIGRAKVKYDPGSNLNGSYVQSRAIDLDGIYSPESPRFIGRRRQSLIIEKNIANEERADYIAYQGLLRTYQASQSVSVAGLGNPLIEEGDCVYVIDDAKDTVDPTLKKWVQAIDISYDKSGYAQRYTLTSMEPWPSYQPKPPTSSGAFGGATIANLSIQNGGWVGTLASGCSATATKIAISNTNKEYDRTFLAYREYPTEVPSYNIIKIENEFVAITGYQNDGSNMATLLVAERGVRSSSAVIHASGSQTLLPYDPYFSGNEFNNKKVSVIYYLTQPANVCVEIQGMGHNEQTVAVANLTRPEIGAYSPDISADKYQYQDTGWHQLEWDGIDQFGQWNLLSPSSVVGRKYNVLTNRWENETGQIGQGFHVVESSVGYGKFYVKISAVNTATNQPLQILRSNDLDKTIHPSSWGTPGQQYIYTIRGPLLNIQFDYSPDINDDDEGNNYLGGHRFTGEENNQRGLKMNIKSVATSTWDPPRFIVYQMGFKCRNIVSAFVYYRHMLYPDQPEAHWDYYGSVLYNQGTYWGNYEMTPIDAYNTNNGLDFYLPVKSLFTYLDKSCLPGLDLTTPIPPYYITGATYHHSWAFYLGGPHNGECRDRSGRFMNSQAHYNTWVPDIYANSGHYYRYCWGFNDGPILYFFGGDNDPNGDSWGHHKLHAWSYFDYWAP